MKTISFYLLATIILLIPAFYNGYPLVFSDTGSYIGSGMNLEIPQDRPIMYGLFIRFFSLNISLWLVVCLQSLILSFILWHIIKLSYHEISKTFFLIILSLFATFTGLGWYTSQIMPDIFTVVALCAIVLLTIKNNYKTFEKIIFCLILIFAVNAHFSNYLIAVVTTLLLFIITRTDFIKDAKQNLSFLLPILLLATAVAIGSLVNYAVGNTFKMNQGSHVFLMGKMLDSGVLKSFLDDNCKDENYVLCSCKDALPETSRDLLWDPKSPLFQNGGWAESQKSFDKILLDILSSPKHLSLFTYNSFSSSLSQLLQNDVGSGLNNAWYQDPASPPYSQISQHFPFELNQYRQSRQVKNLWGQELDFSFINVVNHLLLVFSSVLLFVVFSSKSKRLNINTRTQIIIITLLLGVLVNAIVAGSLANVYDRLQSRISWVIILSAVLVVISKIEFLNIKLFQILAKKP